tara:strand:+ start:92 stop:361 length:270 start_codon:yes stop_codon:yes gene_type:complete
MGIRRVGTPAEEKQTEMTRAAGVAKRARADKKKKEKWIKEYGSVNAGHQAELNKKGARLKTLKKRRKSSKVGTGMFREGNSMYGDWLRD